MFANVMKQLNVDCIMLLRLTFLMQSLSLLRFKRDSSLQSTFILMTCVQLLVYTRKSNRLAIPNETDSSIIRYRLVN